jgi:hypothetical protein
MTQREAAFQLGVRQASISNWERGLRFPWGRIHGKLIAFVGGGEAAQATTAKRQPFA